MTPEERAGRIVDMIHQEETEINEPYWRKLIADEIRATVAEEREACAKIADEWQTPTDTPYGPTNAEIAAAIRSRPL